MTKSKKKNKKKKFNLIDWLDKYVFRAVNFVVFFYVGILYFVAKNNVDDAILRKKGISTYAEVVSIRKKTILKTGQEFVYRYYRFYVPEYGQYYIGRTTYEKNHEQIGDSIEILYNKIPKFSIPYVS